MDTVKAIISVGEVTIQLEGAQEFVEKYLDKYEQLIVSPPTVRKTTKIAEKEKAKTPAKRKPKTKTGPTCTEKVQELIDEGYFKGEVTRTRADVQAELLNRGNRFESNEVSAVLYNFFMGNKLRRTGAGKNAKYYSNV